MGFKPEAVSIKRETYDAPHLQAKDHQEPLWVKKSSQAQNGGCYILTTRPLNWIQEAITYFRKRRNINHPERSSVPETHIPKPKTLLSVNHE
jgi:hypothetical protein